MSRSFATALSVLALLAIGAPARAGTLYSNPGDNTRGFSTQYGNLAFSSDGTRIIGAPGGGYALLPVQISGDFKMSFDVYGDSGDVDSDILILNAGTAAGIEVRNCPQDTDTPNLYLEAGSNFSNYQGFYWDLRVLVMEIARHFPNHAWTHVMISRSGDELIDNVAGQRISIDSRGAGLGSALQVGLGYYATTNLGGAGQIYYRCLRISTPSRAAPRHSDDSDAPPPAPAIRPGWD